MTIHSCLTGEFLRVYVQFAHVCNFMLLARAHTAALHTSPHGRHSHVTRT